MSASLRVSWQEGVKTSRCDGELVVAGHGSRTTLREIAPEIADAIERLAPPGDGEDQLTERLLAAGKLHSLARWHYYLDQLGRRGLIRRSLYSGDRLIAMETPLGGASPPVARGAPDASYVLSRFAYLRRRGDEFVLESPTSHWRIALYDPAAIAVVGALVSPSTAGELANSNGNLEPDAIAALVGLLARSGLAVEVGAGREPAEDVDSALGSWEFHDLLFHARSRRGRFDATFGGSYRLAHRPPPPAIKAISGAETLELYRPDLKRLECDDPPFAAVQERRRSIRTYASQPVTARQLGEFLYRVARVKNHWQAEVATPAGTVPMDFASRPYPAGGALYELEFYLAVRACQNLSSGLYYYQPEPHRLARLAGPTADVERLIDDAASSAGMAAQSMQLLVILAARLPRIAWKYESIAYALALKHVGVVYQTMYLVATAMDLAPCGLGCGDADAFAKAAGLDYYAEASVGEFLLGSRRSDQV
ncbi:MAG TPA: SagB family peptide dehydrogenase [Pirellulales bacterium]|nr:SagB family peptide dehydrogenase [Pirellulales bacterium]